MWLVGQHPYSIAKGQSDESEQAGKSLITVLMTGHLKGSVLGRENGR